MIVFDLQCINGHIFEGWFDDGNAYEEQKEKGLISCPVCNNTSVSKVLSTFAIKSSHNSSSSSLNLPSGGEMSEVGDRADNGVDMAELGKKIVDFVDKNFDNVGSNFAKEALKIHYGVSSPRNIRGVSTESEEKMLKEEGIKFFKIPIPTSSED